MPYLCKVPLNPLRSTTQSLLSSRQALHSMVEKVIPVERSGRLLWRLERVDPRVDLLILSPDQPFLDPIVEQAGWPGNDYGSPRFADLSPLLGQLAIGKSFSFKLMANTTSAVKKPMHPTSSQVVKKGERSTRVGHRTVAHQLEWFISRALSGQWGFTAGTPDMPTVQVIAREQLRFAHKARDYRTGIRLDTATFQGTLTVTNVELLQKHLLEGIGRGKAYGCGLLTLAGAVNVVES